MRRVPCAASCSLFGEVRSREREREMFYLTTHSTHFIYGYMASDIWLRTILIVRKETRCRHIGYSYRLTARVLLYAPSHIEDNTYHGLCYTSRGALAGARNGYQLSVKLPHPHVTTRSAIHHSRAHLDSAVHPVLHGWCNRGCCMCYPVCEMVYIKYVLLLE